MDERIERLMSRGFGGQKAPTEEDKLKALELDLLD